MKKVFDLWLITIRKEISYFSFYATGLISFHIFLAFHDMAATFSDY